MTNDILRVLMLDLKPPEAQAEALQELVSPEMSPAHYVWLRLRQMVSQYESLIESDCEVRIEMRPTGERVENISYWSPDLLIFECAGIERKIVIQHISRLDFSLSKTRRKPESAPAHRIGFIAPSE